MGEPALRLIAHELMTNIKENVTVDWMHREAARARIRVLVKKILRKYGLSASFRIPPYRQFCNKRKHFQRSGQMQGSQRMRFL